MEPTIDTAKKVLEVVNQGLCQGLGNPIPGQMCVEAAVCYALGEPHGDNPSCVGPAVRSFKITLNDAAWSSKEARASGMLKVAIAQLGSNAINQVEFAKIVSLETIRQILPDTLRTLKPLIPSHADQLEISAVLCESATDLITAKSAAKSAKSAAKSAAESAESAAWSAAWSAESAAWSAESAKSAAWSAESAESAADKRDRILGKAAEIAVQALIKLGCLGASWLWLTK